MKLENIDKITAKSVNVFRMLKGATFVWAKKF
jgi:hypothetical protein